MNAKGKRVGFIMTHADDFLHAGDAEFEEKVIGSLYNIFEMDDTDEGRVMTTSSENSNALRSTFCQADRTTTRTNMTDKDESRLERSNSTGSKPDEIGVSFWKYARERSVRSNSRIRDMGGSHQEPLAVETPTQTKMKESQRIDEE